MRKLRWMTGSLVGLAMMAGAVTPAEARPRHGYGHGGGWDRGGWGHRRDRGDGFGVGDAIGVAALIGAVAVVASSMSKDRKARDGGSARNDGEWRDDAPPRDGTDYGSDDVERGGPRAGADFPGGGMGDAPIADEGVMTDACAIAARDEAQGMGGGYAEIRHMEAPRATPSGYNIDGEVETRDSWRATGGTTRRFTCSMKDGRVAEVYLARDVAAR